MSNHFSADYLKAPGDDRRLDLTDVFCFKSSKDTDKLILIMNSNPSAPAPAPVPARSPPDRPCRLRRGRSARSTCSRGGRSRLRNTQTQRPGSERTTWQDDRECWAASPAHPPPRGGR